MGETMNKSQLVVELAQRLALHDNEALELVNFLLTDLADNLVKDNRVEIRGFGTFGVQEREQRLGRNPRSGEMVQIPKRRRVFFRAGKVLRENVNAKASIER